MDRILTVITPASSKDLTDLGSVKLQLGITDDASDDLLSAYIPMASRTAANYCNGEFILETVSEQFRPYPFIDSISLTNLPEYIRLQRFPVVTITSITEDDVVLVEGTDFECDKSTGRCTRLNNDMPLRWRFRKLVVQYSGGYTYPGTLEPDISQAAIEITKDMWFSGQRDQRIKSKELLSGLIRTDYWVGSIHDTSAWPPKVTDLLAPWQRPIF